MTIPVYRHRYHAEYARAKRCYMAVGHEYERLFADAVGGSRGPGGDVTSNLGLWEFAAAPNTKNHAGDLADQDRAPGHCVQVTGKPRLGWITAAEYLELHGYHDHAEQIALELVLQAQHNVEAMGEQVVLDLG